MSLRSALTGLWGILQSEDPRSEDARRPAIRTRVIVAVAIGIASGAFSGLLALRPDAAPDFLFPLTGARHFLEGRNPYLSITGEPGAPPPYNAPFFYPFTSVLPAIPFAWLSNAVAVATFFGLSSGLLAFFVTRDGLWRVHVFMSAPFVVAAALGQYSPLLTVAGLIPAAGFLAAFKPNVGLAIISRRPTLPAIVGCLAVGALSVAIFPSWPSHWLATMRRDLGVSHVYEIPLLQTGGFLLILAALAWRRPAGRLLLAMSAVPQALFFYDQLPLWLVARTRNQSILLTAASQLACMLWYLMREPGTSAVLSAYPYVLALVYLPALLIVLRNRSSA